MLARARRVGVRMALVGAVACGGGTHAAVKATEPAPQAACQDPPEHRYAVPVEVERLLDDDVAWATFAAALRADLEADLAGPEACDLDRTKNAMFDLAILDALEGKWPEAVARLDGITAIESDPGMKVMRGLTIRVWAEAMRASGGVGDDAAYRAALERVARGLEWELVEDALPVLVQIAQSLTPEVSHQALHEYGAEEAAGGTVGMEVARAIVFQRYALRRIVPVAAITVEVVGQIIREKGEAIPVQ